MYYDNHQRGTDPKNLLYETPSLALHARVSLLLSSEHRSRWSRETKHCRLAVLSCHTHPVEAEAGIPAKPLLQ